MLVVVARFTSVHIISGFTFSGSSFGVATLQFATYTTFEVKANGGGKFKRKSNSQPIETTAKKKTKVVHIL